jgi:predicted ribosome quality control (RQC) complex YloA/Tae2 family protein
MKTFKSPDGHTVLLGENASDNNKVMKNACQTDVWFHLESMPSCHVVIKCSMKQLQSKCTEFCANLVKQNSKGKNFNKIKVVYLSMRYVSKTETPGQVILKKSGNIIVV